MTTTKPLRRRAIWVATLIALAAPLTTISAAEAAIPTASALPGAYSHNDYDRAVPLSDALGQGFTAAEADIWLTGPELSIGHFFPDTARTLIALYLDPLQRQLSETGSIIPGFGGTFTLMVDVKSDGFATLPVLSEQLSRYPDLVTHWVNGQRISRPIQVVASGNLANVVIPEPTDGTARWVGSDGRIGALPPGATPEQFPVVSNNWNTMSGWNGNGPIPQPDLDRLRATVEPLRAAGFTVRYWNTNDGPGRETLWATLLDNGVGLLNTEDLPGLRGFLLTR